LLSKTLSDNGVLTRYDRWRVRALDSYLSVRVLVIGESALENRRRALRQWAMGIPIRILDDLGSRPFSLYFLGLQASGTHTAPSSPVARAGVLNFAGGGAAWGDDAFGSDLGDRAVLAAIVIAQLPSRTVAEASVAVEPIE